MVRGGAGRGCEGRIRKGQTPLWVNEETVQACKNGRVLLIRPGKLTVQERDFKKAESINEIIESGSFSSVEIPIRFIARGAQKVEIPN
jgi:hypothetical protein